LISTVLNVNKFFYGNRETEVEAEAEAEKDGRGREGWQSRGGEARGVR